MKSNLEIAVALKQVRADLDPFDQKIAIARLDSALAAIQAQPDAAVGGWQPIETAPKDGTCILLGRAEDEENDRGAISTPGRWHEEDHDGPDNMGHDAGFMDDEFQQFAWVRSFGNSAYRNGGFQPTHWQSLPPPPVQAQGSDAA